jgi:hypothetical protein
MNTALPALDILPALPSHTPHLRSHIAGARDHLENDSDELRQSSPEQMLYQEYRLAGMPHGPALYAVKGEHWNSVCPQFLEFINGFRLERHHMG